MISRISASKPTICLLLLTLLVSTKGFQTSLLNPRLGRQNTPSRHGYANTENAPPPQFSPESLEDLMRARIRQQQQELAAVKETTEAPVRKAARNPFRTMSRPSFLREVSTLMDYKTTVAQERDRMSIVRFYSPNCRACKAATPIFDMLAYKYPQLNWVEVPVTQDNKQLHQGLGVPSVPFGHVYVPDVGLVEELRMIRPQMQRFGQILECYVNGQCDLPEEVNDEGIYASPFKPE